jgi:hypothetical protein
MSAKRLAVLVVPIYVLASLVFVPGVSAQINQLSITSGLTFVSTQSVPGVPPPNQIHFGDASGSIVAGYGRLLKTAKIFGIYAELPVGVIWKTDLNYFPGGVPKDYAALFVTPSVRVNIFSGDSVTPWVSAGGGYGRFRESKSLYYYGSNPDPTGTNTGVVQFGAGLDVWFWHTWGARFEARDFYSGAPDLIVDTGRSRQHNYYVGAGVTHRF